MDKQLQKKLTIGVIVAAFALFIGDMVIDIAKMVFVRAQDRAVVDLSLSSILIEMVEFVGFLLLGAALYRLILQNSSVAKNFQRHATAVETSMDGIAIYDEAWNYRYVNPAYSTINGYASPQDLIGKPFRTSYDEQSVNVIEQVIAPAVRSSGKWRGELIAKRKNGSTYFQEASMTQLPDGGFVCIVRDITWRKRSETRLRRSEQFLNNIFNSIRDPFCIFDNEYRIIRINEAYAQLKDRTADQLIGRKCYEALNGRDRICEGCVVEKSLLSKDPCAKEKQTKLPNGEEIWVEIYTYPILDEEGRVSHVIEYTRDITTRKRSEEEKRKLIEKLERLSRIDDLTGLLNRRALTESLTYEIDRACRYDTGLALLLCDIDGFKEVNDTYGHDAGDYALQTISAVLKTQLRKTDIAGRYGGDEFMLILPETSQQGAESLADKLRSAIESAEFRFTGGKTARLSMSIGVTAKVPIGETVDSFTKRADEAMYTSRDKTRGTRTKHPS